MSEQMMSDEEKRQWEEARRACEEFNNRMKPIEDAFMSYVRAYEKIGYGRMIQMIQEEWNKKLGERRSAHFSEGDGKGFTRDVP